MVIIYLVVPLF